MSYLDIIRQPWPWYVAGPLIGLTVPTLLLIGNKSFGISSSLRHICAACLPADISFFKYNWKKEAWNLVFVVGVLLGGFVATYFLSNPNTFEIAPATEAALRSYGIHDFSGLMPADLFATGNLFTLKGLVFFVIGGLLVGFGIRYAGGAAHRVMPLWVSRTYSGLHWWLPVALWCGALP